MDSVQKAFIMENFLNEQELTKLDNISAVVPKQVNYHKTEIYTSGFEYNLIKSIVHEKLKNMFGDFNVRDCMILEQMAPWSIHTDYDKGDMEPTVACLMPIEIGTQDSYTVVFNEEAKANKEILELPDSKNKLDEQTLAMLDHCPVKELQKVSLLDAYKWKRGSLICWSRKLLHASHNFKKSNVDKRKALVLFLNKDWKETWKKK